MTDLDEIIVIEQQAQIAPWSQRMFINSLNAGHICIALWKQNVIVGFAVMSMAQDEAEILNIAIKPEKQQQGFGTKLMRHLLEIASTKKIFLEVRASNLAAIQFYQKFGCNQIAVRKDYYQTASGREDALVFSLNPCHPVA
jgi:ribosomal-protein-alanine N-acetyltransferase